MALCKDFGKYEAHTTTADGAEIVTVSFCDRPGSQHTYKISANQTDGTIDLKLRKRLDCKGDENSPQCQFYKS